MWRLQSAQSIFTYIRPRNLVSIVECSLGAAEGISDGAADKEGTKEGLVDGLSEGKDDFVGY